MDLFSSIDTPDSARERVAELTRLIDKYNHELTIALLAVFAIGIVYVIIKWIVSAKKRKVSDNQ